MYRASFIVLIWFKSSPNNVEIVDGNIVTTDVVVVIYGRGGFQMFLEPFSKCSWGLSNIFFITVHPVTFISVDDSTLLLDWIFVFGSHQEVLDSGASFTIHLYPKLFCQCSWCSHWVHYTMVPLCKTSGYCYWFCLLELFFCLVSLFSSEFYWEQMNQVDKIYHLSNGNNICQIDNQGYQWLNICHNIRQ